MAKERKEKWTGGKQPVLGGVEKAEAKPKAPKTVTEDEENDSSGWEDDNDND